MRKHLTEINENSYLWEDLAYDSLSLQLLEAWRESCPEVDSTLARAGANKQRDDVMHIKGSGQCSQVKCRAQRRYDMRHEMLTQRALFCHHANTKPGTLSQHFVTHVVPPLCRARDKAKIGVSTYDVVVDSHYHLLFPVCGYIAYR